MPSKIRNVGRCFFLQCEKLETIEFLADSLLFVERTFVSCTNLSIVVFSNARKVTFGMDVFFQVSDDCSFFFCACTDVNIEILL